MSDMSASSTNIPWPKSRLDSRYDCALCRLAGGGGSGGGAQWRFSDGSFRAHLSWGLLLLATAMYCINRSTLLYKTVVFRLRCCLHACKADYCVQDGWPRRGRKPGGGVILSNVVAPRRVHDDGDGVSRDYHAA